MNANQARELLQRYQTDSCTAGEKVVVEQWWHQLISTGEWQWGEGEKEMFQKQMEGRLLEIINTKSRPVHTMRTYRWWAAAAVLFIVAGGYLYFNRTPHSTANYSPDNAGPTANSDIAPPPNKATLTLSNGSVIILDSAQNGLLAKQSGANIIKSDSGALEYTVNEKLPTANYQLPITSYNTLNNPRGSEAISLTLTDGTKVWLNSESSLRYPTSFLGKERKVEITGEAYFEVAHNAAMPFRVKAGDQTIEDIGTQFNVNAYSDEPGIKTTLLKGSVKISLLLPAERGTNYQLPMILKPGEAFINGKKIHTDTELDIAWKNGVFKFKNTNIEAIMRQVARWYDVDVSYQGNFSDLNFGGTVSRKSNVSELLKRLEATESVKFKVEGRKIMVTN